MVENKIIEVLNDLKDKDSQSLLALLSYTHPTNDKVLGSYDVRIEKHGYPTIGLLSILNKIIEDSGKKIKMEYSVDKNSYEFKVLGFSLIDVK